MNNRNKILACLLAIQLLLIVVVFWRNGEQPAEKVQMVTGLAADQIDRLLITDEEGRELPLRLQEGEWQVEIEKDVWYPADSEKVKVMVEKLVELQSSRLVTRTRGSHDRLKVAEKNFSRRLQLSSGKDDPAVLYLGSAPNYKSIHARTAGDDNVYLVRDLSAWEAQAEAGSWWRTSYVEVDPETLMEVELQNEKGEFLLARDDKHGEWVAMGSNQKLDKEKLTNFLDDVSQLSVTNISLSSEPEPAEEPLAVLGLKSVDRQIKLEVWERQDESSDHQVKVSDDSFYAMAGRYAVDDLLNISIIDLVESLPATKKE